MKDIEALEDRIESDSRLTEELQKIAKMKSGRNRAIDKLLKTGLKPRNRKAEKEFMAQFDNEDN